MRVLPAASTLPPKSPHRYRLDPKSKCSVFSPFDARKVRGGKKMAWGWGWGWSSGFLGVP